MKRQYFYLMTFIFGTLSNTMGAEESSNKSGCSKPPGRAILMSSQATNDEEDDFQDEKNIISPPPIASAYLPSLKSSSPKEIPQPKLTSPTARVLKTRTNHPSGDYSSATPKSSPSAAHKPQPKNPLKESSAGDE